MAETQGATRSCCDTCYIYAYLWLPISLALVGLSVLTGGILMIVFGVIHHLVALWACGIAVTIVGNLVSCVGLFWGFYVFWVSTHPGTGLSH